MSACQAPFGLGQPSTRALENGAVGTLAAAKSFEIAGSYTESGLQWSIEMQVVRSGIRHVIVSSSATKLEAIIFLDPTGFIVTDGYFRGNQFLSQHMGDDPASRNLVKAAENAWWKSSAAQVPRLPDLIDGAAFRTTFLGTALSQRTDHVVVDGLDAVNLSGPRADVYVDANPPHQLLRLRLQKGASVDGIFDADFSDGGTRKPGSRLGATPANQDVRPRPEGRRSAHPLRPGALHRRATAALRTGALSPGPGLRAATPAHDRAAA